MTIVTNAELTTKKAVAIKENTAVEKYPLVAAEPVTTRPYGDHFTVTTTDPAFFELLIFGKTYKCKSVSEAIAKALDAMAKAKEVDYFMLQAVRLVSYNGKRNKRQSETVYFNRDEAKPEIAEAVEKAVEMWQKQHYAATQTLLRISRRQAHAKHIHRQRDAERNWAGGLINSALAGVVIGNKMVDTFGDLIRLEIDDDELDSEYWILNEQKVEPADVDEADDNAEINSEPAETTALEVEIDYEAAKSKVRLEYDKNGNEIWSVYGTIYKKRVVNCCKKTRDRRDVTFIDWERADAETAARVLSKYGLTTEQFIKMQGAEDKASLFSAWEKSGLTAEYVLEIGSADETTADEYREYLSKNEKATVENEKAEITAAPETKLLEMTASAKSKATLENLDAFLTENLIANKQKGEGYEPHDIYKPSDIEWLMTFAARVQPATLEKIKTYAKNHEVKIYGEVDGEWRHLTKDNSATPTIETAQPSIDSNTVIAALGNLLVTALTALNTVTSTNEPEPPPICKTTAIPFTGLLSEQSWIYQSQTTFENYLAGKKWHAHIPRITAKNPDAVQNILKQITATEYSVKHTYRGEFGETQEYCTDDNGLDILRWYSPQFTNDSANSNILMNVVFFRNDTPVAYISAPAHWDNDTLIFDGDYENLSDSQIAEVREFLGLADNQKTDELLEIRGAIFTNSRYTWREFVEYLEEIAAADSEYLDICDEDDELVDEFRDSYTPDKFAVGFEGRILKSTLAQIKAKVKATDIIDEIHGYRPDYAVLKYDAETVDEDYEDPQEQIKQARQALKIPTIRLAGIDAELAALDASIIDYSDLEEIIWTANEIKLKLECRRETQSVIDRISRKIA